MPLSQLRFNGADYVPPRDDPRLTRQYHRIFDLMRDGAWRTLVQIQAVTDDPAASISAQLRHMRKARFGGHRVNRRHLGDGLYEYQVIVCLAQAKPPQRRSLHPAPPVVTPRRRS